MNRRISSFKDKLVTYAQSHHALVYILSIILILAISAGAYQLSVHYTVNRTNYKISASIVNLTPKAATKYYSPLTGLEVASQAIANEAVTGIMIENSPDARPQSGLKNSGVVFEAIAEGGITRFAVLYQQQKPQLIGPVRSVRIYYVDWMAPFNASIAHVGGSAAALTEVRNGSYRDIDQFFNAAYYWRATDRYAPHNVYTSFAKLDALNAADGYTTSSFTGFVRKDSSAADIPTATSISVHISGPWYDSSYIYNKTTNTYDRSEGGEPHMDREDGQISPRVVIILKMPMSEVMQDGMRESMGDIGSGEATIFQDGLVVQGTWTKKSKTDQITFTDANGKTIALARGQTWITAIPDDSGSVTWK